MWHPSEHKVVAGCVDSSVWMWGGVTFAHLNTFLGHGDLVTYGDFTPNDTNFSSFGAFFVYSYYLHSYYI